LYEPKKLCKSQKKNTGSKSQLMYKNADVKYCGRTDKIRPRSVFHSPEMSTSSRSSKGSSKASTLSEFFTSTTAENTWPARSTLSSAARRFLLLYIVWPRHTTWKGGFGTRWRVQQPAAHRRALLATGRAVALEADVRRVGPLEGGELGQQTAGALLAPLGEDAGVQRAALAVRQLVRLAVLHVQRQAVARHQPVRVYNVQFHSCCFLNPMTSHELNPFECFRNNSSIYLFFANLVS